MALPHRGALRFLAEPLTTPDRWRIVHGAHPRRISTRLKARRARRVTEALDERNVWKVGPEDVAEIDLDGVLLLNLNTPGMTYERACRHTGARADDSARM
jgi:hypothetical protein